MLLSAHEFTSYPGIPYKAIINEAVELAKSYGGADGHKYVNGVLDKLAKQLRAEELALPAKSQKIWTKIVVSYMVQGEARDYK